MSTAETEAARLLAGDGVASPAGGLPFTGPAAAEASVLLYQEHPLVQLPMYWRWIVLLSVSLLSISGYFIYDNIGALEERIEEALSIDSSKFALLYSVYTFPNMVLPFFGGWLVDSFLGHRVGLLLCLGTAFLGVFLTSLSVYVSTPDAFYVMLAGRFLFGLGTETSYVAQNSIICEWFGGTHELALAMGVSVSAGRLGAFFTFNLNQLIATHFGLPAALWFATLLAGLTVLGGVVYVWADIAARRRLPRSLLRKDSAADSQVDLRDVIHFRVEFWVACVVITLYYAVIFPFQSTATKMLQDNYNITEAKAGQIVSILPLMALVLSPAAGLMVDLVRRRAILAMLGLVLMMPAFMWLAETRWTPIVPCVVIGLMFSLVPAAIWPCIPLLVGEKYTGTAFGLMSGLINSALTGLYYVQAWVSEYFSFKWQMWLLVALSALGALFGCLWNWLDFRLPRSARVN